MKLIIQIPCHNEEETLATTLRTLPRQVTGFDRVEWLLIDDGSTDRSVEIARSNGVEYVVRMNGRKGLARAFMAGVLEGVYRGADVIVNTDADNQYNAEDIPALVKPIVERQADIVVGARPIQSIQHFSPLKRCLQGWGSQVARGLSKTEVQDATSGFRAFTRDAALRLNVFNSYTYTLETLIQAGLSNLRVANVPIRVNGPTRPSRLIKSVSGYIRRGVITMFNTYLIYKPVEVFGFLALAFLTPGLFLAIRYIFFMLAGSGHGHVQSVVAAGALIICGIFMAAIGIVGHLLAINRRLLEELRYLAYSRSRE